jgi:hypothetical protein
LVLRLDAFGDGCKVHRFADVHDGLDESRVCAGVAQASGEVLLDLDDVDWRR